MHYSHHVINYQLIFTDFLFTPWQIWYPEDAFVLHIGNTT